MDLISLLPGYFRKKIRELNYKKEFILDLNKVQLIKNSSIQDLKNLRYVENLIINLGLNKELLDEQPEIVRNNGGGLLIWQYPNQFSKYLLFLQKQKINSYLEIGCRWGGTFILTNEYLKKFNIIKKSVAIDLLDSPVKNYCSNNKETKFIKINSKSEKFKNYIKLNFFDLILIDGDHSYEAVKSDYELIKDSSKIIVFHDVVNNNSPGTVKFWNEIKENKNYYSYEFIEQYEEIYAHTGKKFLGLGLIIKK